MRDIAYTKDGSVFTLAGHQVRRLELPPILVDDRESKRYRPEITPAGRIVLHDADPTLTLNEMRFIIARHQWQSRAAAESWVISEGLDGPLAYEALSQLFPHEAPTGGCREAGDG